MSRVASAALWIVAAVGIVGVHGCTDLGDSSAIPSDQTSDAGANLASVTDDGSVAVVEDGSPGTEDGPSSASEAGPETSTVVTGGGDDSGNVVGNADDSGAGEDAFVFDAGVDATIEDSGLADTGGSTKIDTGVDAASDATVASDAGKVADSGTDAAKSGGGLVPCTTAGQTNCVQCQFNNGAAGTFPNTTKLCTPTEAALVAHDIATGQATTAGPDPASACYACAAEQGCLDDSEFNDNGHECEDLSGAAGIGECEATLACVLSSSCGSSGTLSACFCGTAPVSGTCAAVGASNKANGACVTSEATGLGFATNDGLDILKNFTSTTLPSGIANNIFQCAITNSCTTCLQ